MKVLIIDLYDGFEIVVLDERDILIERFAFDQEDTRERMPEVFKMLGIQAEYEESY